MLCLWGNFSPFSAEDLEEWGIASRDRQDKAVGLRSLQLLFFILIESAYKSSFNQNPQVMCKPCNVLTATLDEMHFCRSISTKIEVVILFAGKIEWGYECKFLNKLTSVVVIFLFDSFLLFYGWVQKTFKKQEFQFDYYFTR